MIRELRAEILAVRSQRFIRVLTLLWAFITGANSWTTLDQNVPLGVAFLREATVASWANLGVPMACIVGATIMGQEYRHGSLATRIAGGTHRYQVFGAKVLIAAVFSGFFALVGVLVSGGIVFLDDRSVAGRVWTELLTVSLRAMIGLMIVAIIAASLASLVKSELIGVILSIGWFGLGERIVGTIVGDEILGPANRVLPGQIVAGLSSVRDVVTIQEGALLGAWCIALVACGLLVFMRVDVETA